MNTRATLLILLFILTFYSHISKAGPKIENHSHILQAVQQFLDSQKDIQKYKHSSVTIGYLDKRLRLSACQKPLETFLAPGSKLVGKTSIGVRCSSSKPWALYVPVSITLISDVYQALRPLSKGQIIREQDLLATEYDISQLNYGYFTNKEDLIGKQVKRRLKQNQVITPNQITEPLLVKRGEKVTLVAKSNRFAIRMNGEALMNGSLGDRIRVKNTSSKRIIEGTVTRHSEVTVYN